MSVTLMAGEGVEVKMEMEKGATVKYRWAASGGAVASDAHGGGSEIKFSVSYKKGQEALQDEGVLEAAFKGQHGWYWKNRGQAASDGGTDHHGAVHLDQAAVSGALLRPRR